MQSADSLFMKMEGSAYPGGKSKLQTRLASKPNCDRSSQPEPGGASRFLKLCGTFFGRADLLIVLMCRPLNSLRPATEAVTANPFALQLPTALIRRLTDRVGSGPFKPRPYMDWPILARPEATQNKPDSVKKNFQRRSEEVSGRGIWPPFR